MRDRAVWLLRALWFVLPVTAGRAIAGLVEDSSDGTRLVVLAGAWVLWAVTLICTAVLVPITLTGVRMLAPAASVVVAWATLGVDTSALDLIGLATALAATAVAFSSLVGDRMVDGASYGDERRVLLRAPTMLLAGPVPFTWAIAVAGLVTGPLLLCAGRWVVGPIVTVVGFGLAGFGTRILHQLSRRWLVFVPTGLVLHDLMVLTEPVLFRRTAVERFGPAIDGTPARDLSRGASGLLLECELTDPAPLGLRRGRGSGADAELTDVRRFLVAPSLPGAVLDEAERRRIAVG